MQRAKLLLWAVAVFSPVLAVGQEVPAKNDLPVLKTKATVVPEPGQAEQPDKTASDDDQSPQSSESVSSKRAADEEAICLTALAFVKAYNSADAKGIATLFAPDADYIDEDGNVFQGRKAVAAAIAAYWDKIPGAQMDLIIHSIRFVSPDVAVEDGSTIVRAKDETSEAIETRYTAVHVKKDGKWLTASAREQAPKDRRPHRTQLQQLAWLQGVWVSEGDDTLVISSCKPANGGNFLLREFKVHIAGQHVTSGTQRIGWDPVTGKLKSWVFDSTGGYSEGFWERDDDGQWVLKSVGVTANGQPASSTVIYTLINADMMTWQSVDHEVGGQRLPDSPVVKIVRRAPPPETSDGAVNRELEPTIDGHRFEIWVPVGRSDWSSLWLKAGSSKGESVAYLKLNAFELRQAAVEGIKLTLIAPLRHVDVKVLDNGVPVAGAWAKAEQTINVISDQPATILIDRKAE